jgi:hypothetical protein
MIKQRVKLYLCLNRNHTTRMYGGLNIWHNTSLTNILYGGEWLASCPGCWTTEQQSQHPQDRRLSGVQSWVTLKSLPFPWLESRFWTIQFVTYFKQNSSGTAWPLKIGPISCPKTSVTNYHSTLRKTPEEPTSQNYIHLASSALNSFIYY